MSNLEELHFERVEPILEEAMLAMMYVQNMRNKYPPNKALIEAIKATKLNIYNPVADLGYFGWNQEGTYQELDEITADDVKKRLDIDGKPPIAVSVKQLLALLPEPFANLPPREYINKYPFKPPYVTPIHVAVRHRGVDMNDVDFVFGGSTLEFLSTWSRRDRDNVVTLFPGTTSIMIASHKEYKQDSSDVGFQFERFVTSESFRGEHRSTESSHLQLMDVAGYRVLFSAQVEAMDQNKDPIKITCSNPYHLGTRKLYQMLSSGSLTLYKGSKDNGSLTNVTADSFGQVASDGLRRVDVSKHELHMVQAMTGLLKERDEGRFEGGKVFKISFEDNALKLEPFTEADILVPDSVIVKLIL
jgi:hypothetical protein